MDLKYKRLRKILVVEDDENLAKVIKSTLEPITPDITLKYNGKEGLKEARLNHYSLIILDLALPGMNGLEIIETLRNYKIKTPIIVITNFELKQNELKSYERGVNLFHPKPIDYDLFLTQVKSLLTYQAEDVVVEVDHIKVNTELRTVSKESKEISLSGKEFKTLLSLLSEKGKILSRADLLNQTYKKARDLELGSIDTLICRLRNKLKKINAEDLIQTVHGEGYRINLKYLE